MLKSVKSLAQILFLASILSLTLCGAWTYSLYQKAFEANAHIINVLETIRSSNRLILSVNEAAIDVSQFVITRQIEALSRLPEIIVSIDVNNAVLLESIANDDTEIAIYNNLKPLLDSKIKFLREVAAKYESHDAESILKMSSGKERLPLSVDITSLVIAIKNIEKGRLEEAGPQFQLLKYRADSMFILLGTLNVFLLLASYVLIRKSSN